jgi:group I intron endonuclease
MKYYTIYKITNKINGKYYIGKHITEDLNDDYLGSGKLIRKAIEKYGFENFEKEILKIYDNEHDMNIAESLLIDLSDKKTYNLQPGGIGSWQYINENNLSNTEECKIKKSITMKNFWTEEKRKEKSQKMKKYFEENGTERHSESLKERYKDPTYKEKFIKKMKLVNKDENKKKKASQKIKEKWENDLEFQEKMKKRKPRGSDGSALKAKWDDPVWRNKMLESRKNKRNAK